MAKALAARAPLALGPHLEADGARALAFSLGVSSFAFCRLPLLGRQVRSLPI